MEHAKDKSLSFCMQIRFVLAEDKAHIANSKLKTQSAISRLTKQSTACDSRTVRFIAGSTAFSMRVASSRLVVGGGVATNRDEAFLCHTFPPSGILFRDDGRLISI